jgi:hypothetical protein
LPTLAKCRDRLIIDYRVRMGLSSIACLFQKVGFLYGVAALVVFHAQDRVAVFAQHRLAIDAGKGSLDLVPRSSYLLRRLA